MNIKTVEYLVVESTKLLKLERKVNTLLQEWYELEGGIHSCDHKSRWMHQQEVTRTTL